MSKPEKSDIQNSNEDESIAHLLFPNEELKENKGLEELFPSELSVEPLYAPILKAAEELKREIEAQTQTKIETIKHETAEQTKDIYQKLTEARDEFKRIEVDYNEKIHEVEALTQIQKEIENDLQDARAINETQNKKNSALEMQLENANGVKSEEISVLTEKHDALIEKLKNKIDQINQDYSHQIANLQQKLSYQQQQLNSEIAHLTEENELLSTSAKQLKEAQTNSPDLLHQLEILKIENLKYEQAAQEKAEKLTRSDNALKLANDELERSQQYIKELEDKNNSIQKELFENWIRKEDEL